MISKSGVLLLLSLLLRQRQGGGNRKLPLGVLPPDACGVWSFSHDAGKGKFKSAKTFTGQGAGRWREETFTIMDAVMNHNGPRGADIALLNLDDKDKIFHLIEVRRGMANSP